VNRSISLAYKNFGSIPVPAELAPEDSALLELARDAFGAVGGLIAQHRQKQAITEAMRVVAEANRYLSDQAPWKLKAESERPRLATILHTALQVISDCNTLLTPFLPHSAQKIHELLGGTGVHAPMPRIEEVADLDGGPGYPIITGDYRAGARWESRPIAVGTELHAPAPVFKKLDPSIVDEELARLGA
jgi:methionyl-tRNA synthetase